MKAFNIKDGCGIHDILIPNGIIPVIITGRQSDIVLNRCKELGVTGVFQGVVEKLEKVLQVTSDLSSVAYIGDDINDLKCMKAVKEHCGIVGCPADAVESVKKTADYITPQNGGEGAVRNFIEWIVEKNKEN